jgi:hypothetical protein
VNATLCRRKLLFAAAFPPGWNGAPGAVSLLCPLGAAEVARKKGALPVPEKKLFRRPQERFFMYFSRDSHHMRHQRAANIHKSV